jgi:hypothetical protein
VVPADSFATALALAPDLAPDLDVLFVSVVFRFMVRLRVYGLAACTGLHKQVQRDATRPMRATAGNTIKAVPPGFRECPSAVAGCIPAVVQ